MFNILKRKKAAATATSENAAKTEAPGFFERLKTGLAKTRANFTDKLASLLLGKKELDAEVFETLETQLLLADVGVEATQQLMDALTQKLKRNELSNVEAAIQSLQADMHALLEPCQVPLTITPEKAPFLILVVGINGAGKTTTIGKLAYSLKKEGEKCHAGCRRYLPRSCY